MKKTSAILHTKFTSACLFVLSGCILASCATSPDSRRDSKLARYLNAPAEVKISGNAIVFNGRINDRNNEKLFDLFDYAEQPPTTLTITSRGGLVDAGLELGEWIIAKQLDVYIPDMCGGSCANYVFTAGKQVTLAEDAAVYWHGSPVIDDLVAGTPEAKERWTRVVQDIEQTKPEVLNPRAYWNKIRIQNRRFFRTIGVHPLVTWPYSVADDNSRARTPKSVSWKNYGMYVSIEDMKHFGVNNVRIENDKVWAPKVDKLQDVELIKISLIDNVQQRLAELKERLNQVL